MSSENVCALELYFDVVFFGGAGGYGGVEENEQNLCCPPGNPLRLNARLAGI